MKLKLLAIFLLLSILLTSCNLGSGQGPDDNGGIIGKPGGGFDNNTPTPNAPGYVEDLGDDDQTFGDDLEDSGIYDGFFDEESADITVEYVSGTRGAYTLEGSTLTFRDVREDSVYSVSGTFSGNIVIDVGDDFKFDLELNGFSLISSSTNPITVTGGDEVTIKAKKDTENYIYDTRVALSDTDETSYSGAIHSNVDLKLAGKGSLNVVSENNNGIHSKKDLEVKNLTLLVTCRDNALKGNDSVKIESGELTLIAKTGDCIKTTDSDVSEKGNQRGYIEILGGSHTLYAACDGIDAAYNAVIEGEDTVVKIYTDKYSNYSEEVNDVTEAVNYIRYSSGNYTYSVKYYNNDDDTLWVNAEYHSKVQSGRSTYYFYSFPKKSGYAKMQFFVYSSSMAQGQDENFLYATDYLTPNDKYDTFAITSRGNQLTYSWTNYTTSSQGGFPGGGPGGMQDGNSDKGDHSTKGIKAASEIIISGGTVTVKSYDDAIHSGTDTALENGNSPLGNVTVNGGTLSLYTNDDGLHADNTLTINGGTVAVTNAYEGIEGKYVVISGGNVSVYSKDDGINGTATSGTAISISGGCVYIYCTGDGIDSNSRTSYSGISFSGGNTVVISNSGMNSAIDSEQGYSYTGGSVIAIMPKSGMTNETTHCQSFSSVGKSTQLSLSENAFLVASIDGRTAAVKMPLSLSAFVLILGDSSATVKSENSFTEELDINGVYWG